MFKYRNQEECIERDTHEHHHSDNDVCLEDNACLSVDVAEVCGIINRFLSCDTEQVIIPASGAEVTFSIMSNSAWTIDYDDEWKDESGQHYTLTYEKKVGKTIFKITSDENWLYTRTSVIKITNRHSSIKIPILQRYYCYGFMTSEGYWWRCSNGLLVTKVPEEEVKP